jgi:cobalt-zinc-cadmium efflux system membrane fusion protein
MTRVIDSQTHVVAAASGLVLDRQVTQGQVVQTAEPLCVLGDLSSVWLVADVPEEHVQALRVGKRVQAEIPALPGEKVSGLVTYIGATVNPDTRTVTARMDLPNPQHRFKPQMLATMLLMDNPEQRVVVPLESVVRDGNDESIFVQVAPHRYRLQKVALGEETANGRVVIGGLPAGAKIVIEGAFHLNNERRRKSGGTELAAE